jgi:peptidoglycan-associated lipoprotein
VFNLDKGNAMNSIHYNAAATHRLVWATLCSAAVWGLAGCGSNVKLDDKAPAVESRTGTIVNPDGSTGAMSGGTSQSGVTSVDLTKGAAGAGGDLTSGVSRVIYFDYDSYTVREDARPSIDAYGKTLAANRAKKLSVEGHTDDRGGREYNLALGQKRAEAVVRALTVSGATDSQLEAVSFGKERPAATGADEAVYAKNRRVELTNR